MRLDQALNRSRTPVQARFGTVTAVNPGICTVKVAGGEIPVIYLKGGAPSVGDFVRVHRQGVVSYLLNPSSGALWVGDSSLGGVWRIPTTGQNPVFYSTYSPVQGVTEGPDKNIWAVSTGSPSGEIVQMIASGPSIGEVFNLTLLNSSPTGICVGPDKNLWLSDLSGGVWKVTTGFAATFYPLSGSLSEAICSGPDGRLWVADDTGTVWAVTTSGAATPYAIAGSSPVGICAGPDGRLWVVNNSQTVYAVTTSGAYTPFTLAGSNTVGITTGPDGRLWAVDPLEGYFWSLTTSGGATPYPLPGGSLNSPDAIVTGSDGRLWAADGGSGGGTGTADAMTTSGQASRYSLPYSNPTSICTGP